MSVLPCIQTFKTGSYTVTRTDPRTLVMGRVSAPSTSTFSIDAVVQPMPGRDLERLPEGFRSEDMRVLWTDTELKTPGTAQEADKVDIDGELYQVEQVQIWDHDGVHYRVMVRLV